MNKDQNSSTENAGEEKQFDYERFFAEEAAAEKAGQTGRVRAKTTRSAQKAEGDTASAGASELYDWLSCLVSALIICVLVFTFAARIIGIIGSSMVPSFHDGDKVVISRLFFEPEQGDIIVLRKLQFQEEPIIKRVIATEGQTVDIDFTEGIVYVDGKALKESYTADLTYARVDFDGMLTVPEGNVFVMGDNRNFSSDSRDADIGCVDKRYILGKVLVRLFPVSDFEVIENPYKQ